MLEEKSTSPYVYFSHASSPETINENKRFSHFYTGAGHGKWDHFPRFLPIYGEAYSHSAQRLLLDVRINDMLKVTSLKLIALLILQSFPISPFTIHPTIIGPWSQMIQRPRARKGPKGSRLLSRSSLASVSSSSSACISGGDPVLSIRRGDLFLSLSRIK